MKQNEIKNPIKRELKSFGHAVRGLKYFFKTEAHGRFHLISAFVVFVAGFAVGLNAIEWLFVFGSIALVFIVELINTALEGTIDYLAPEWNEKAGKIKDLAAASVLLAAILAVIIGVIIFIPKILNIISLQP